MFLDESGDHDLLIKDRQYPVFVLAGCVIEENYYNNIINPEINNYKLRLFGNAKLILHTADITRNRNGFEALIDKKFRERFYRETNKLMEKLSYTILACAIKKIEHLQKYGEYAVDPYIFSLFCLVERFVFMLKEFEI